MSALDDAAITNDNVDFLKESWWVCSCCIYGYGCAGPSPVCQGQNKCLCCQSSITSDEELCGPMGCIQEYQKFLCLVQHTQFPPQDVSCGICNMFLIGAPPGQPPAGTTSMDLSFMNDAFWCFYCCCAGKGFTGKIAEPLVAGQVKQCCMLQKQFTTEMMGPRGCYNVNQKCCCITSYAVCPPTITPGIGCCNMMFVGDSRNSVARAPVQTQMAAPGQTQMAAPGQNYQMGAPGQNYQMGAQGQTYR